MLKKTFAFATVAAVAMTVAASRRPQPYAQTRDIVDTAVAAGSFKTLAKALEAAGLVNTLKGAWPVHGVRADRRGVREAAGRHARDLLKPENKEKLPSHPHVSRRGRQGDGARTW